MGNTTISTMFGRRNSKKYKTRKLASSITSQCLYDDVFTMYLCHFLPNDLYYLRYILKQIITNSTSPPNRHTMTPVAEVKLEVDSWTTNPKATTSGSSLGFKDNVCEDTLSSQSTYKNKQWLSILYSFHCSKSKATECRLTIKRTVGNSLWGNHGRSE
jgi:hypothetical protein